MKPPLHPVFIAEYPYVVKVNKSNKPKAESWCYVEEVREGIGDWRFLEPNTFYFKREKDASLFSLKWL